MQGAPAVFERYINETLGQYLDAFCIAYLDEILIYAGSDLQDYFEKVNLVFERLDRAELKLGPKKYEFGVAKTKYFEFIIDVKQGNKVDLAKVWQTPTSVKNVRSFLGFANFYRKLISGSNMIVEHLLDLTKKDRAFNGTKIIRRYLSLSKSILSRPLHYFSMIQKKRLKLKQISPVMF